MDSRLELTSLGLGTPIPQQGLSQGPTSWLRPPPSSPGPQARSFTGGLGQLAVPSKAKVETPLLSASPPQQRPPEPRTGDSTGTSLAATPLPSLRVEVEAGGSAVGTPPLSRRKDGTVRLRMDLVAPEETGQVRAGFQVGETPGGSAWPSLPWLNLHPGPLGLRVPPVLPSSAVTCLSGRSDSPSFPSLPLYLEVCSSSVVISLAPLPCVLPSSFFLSLWVFELSLLAL